MSATVPVAPEGERSLLGSVLIDPYSIDEFGLDRVPIDAFYKETNRIMWRHVMDLHSRGEMIDIVNVVEKLRTAGDLEQVGGPSYVVGLADHEGTAAYAHHYARVVLEAFNKRKLMEAAHKTLQQARNGQAFEDILDEAESRLFALRTNERHTIQGALEEAAKYVTGTARVTTGFPALDRGFGGFPAGDLTVIAGRLSMGKSALVHSMLRRRGNAHLLSPDQPMPEILATFASQDSGIPLSWLNTGEATDDQREKFREALENLESMLEEKKISMDDASLKVPRMVREVRRAARAGKELVVIDHAQNVGGDKPNVTRRDLMIEIVNTLKDLAREYGIAVVLMSQLSRDVEQRQGHKPLLSDLSESKAIEEAANLVLFIHREKYYGEFDRGDVADIIVGKNKTGRRNTTCQLLFQEEFAKFKEVME